ncbi:hypothetical protein GGG87_05110 [Streptococcus sp. zg-86]|uniref:NUDIX domain-containing protein n=1 Tax=Streptococcus zhangguiae TaxID=2664091 RepID=A0A6I4RTP2_9STRE|nr:MULTISPECIES: hypothetical protein [unclassified Streptococcus]MTB64373.1 hypothetical protein [Streptococcus sp. zg-86]MTB90683.1 hypothetical protein [Streptococcus sp. zg-36]MWV56322.1 hypothetical protein [Streptococcus sp. zg-70]
MSKLLQDIALRETLEETNQLITISGILHEDSQFDRKKDMPSLYFCYPYGAPCPTQSRKTYRFSLDNL